MSGRPVTENPDRRLFLVSLALALLALALLFVLHPLDAAYQAYLRQGDAYAEAVERAAAALSYEQAARLRPATAEPYLRLAHLYLEWGRLPEALDALAQAERLGVEAPDRERLARLWVDAYTAQADWPAVVERSHRLLAIVPDDPAARRSLARAYIELRAWDAAQAELESLLEIDPSDAWAHERLGALLYGYDSAAVPHLSVARTSLSESLLVVAESPGVDQDPAYASALFGQALFAAEEWALSTRQFERALSYSPGYADVRAYLGHALDQMGHLDEAGPHLIQAVELAPDSVVTRVFLGLYYEQLGDYAAARTEYEVAYDLDPENPATSVALGRTWIAEGRLDVAEFWLTNAVSLAPDDPAVWRILARFYLEYNLTSEERATLATLRLTELAPTDARTHDLQGWASLQAGDYEKAEASLMLALSLDPDLPSAHFHLGLLWQVRGDYERADAAFTRALDLDTTGNLVPEVARARVTP
jgi:tetratricopeptide (TPR) repeat protein